MARTNQEAVETFMNITGVSEAVALQKLEEHGGDLNAAVNAHFNEGNRSIVHQASPPAAQNDLMVIDDPLEIEPQGISSFLSAGRHLNSFSLLDPSFRRSSFEGRGASNFPSHEQLVSHPREVKEIPIEVKDGGNHSGFSGSGPIIEDATEAVHAHVPKICGNVIIDEEDEDIPTALPANTSGQNTSQDRFSGGNVHQRDHRPSALVLDSMTDYSNDIEEEMVQAAIEASKWEVEERNSNQRSAPDDSTGIGTESRHSNLEDAEFERAVSLSLKTAEQEKAMHMQEELVGVEQPSICKRVNIEELGELTTTNGRGISDQFKLEAGSSYVQDETEDAEEQPLVRHRSGQLASGSLGSVKEVVEIADSPPSSPGHAVSTQPLHTENGFESDEWGGISSNERDEAVMLEAALFGGIPEGTTYCFGREMGLYPRHVPRPPSPTLAAQRLLREQQDDEYLASLQADREKELKAREEAEARRLAEQAAREAALEEERRKEEEHQRKLLEEEELERFLAAKEASLPQEPPADDENAVTLLVRLPDGSRHGRRFLKSDNLQLLFDFIDVGRGVKPGTYRLVRPYPRRAFGDGESSLSLSELGLKNKQEALFLELI
ncbi:PREDICTED: plant UBX domain-containing protein 8-like isoform X2 [Nelumbo nucifera]|uniref:Plant UBX domain-containing protein 8-like isoform X2 n=2 Tax=Nelumbo nucifera TaxID=4432 RepID=A0A1U8A2V8_NELNU|nr:PREDICTED: plant UBX domain-containing protein 8-like isoform X2 [Nelumbo nucifera]DAD18802.1 TPA_asm: hypothetical protein HUJ06_020265 [Nelumbo nucifera]